MLEKRYAVTSATPRSAVVLAIEGRPYLTHDLPLAGLHVSMGLYKLPGKWKFLLPSRRRFHPRPT
jgi:hypothetical protein